MLEPARTFATWRLRLQQVSGATLALIGMALFTRIITLLTQIIIANAFGLSTAADAYFIVENIPELFMDFIAISCSMVFIPLFAEYRIHGGETEASKFAGAFLLLSTIISIVFAVLTVLGAPLIISSIAPGFHGEAQRIAVTMTRILSLSLIFLGLDAGVRGLLQSHREFVIPELGRVAYNCVLLSIAWFLSHRYGVLVLAWAIVIGAAAQLAIQVGSALRKGILRLGWGFNHPGVRRAARQVLPFLLAVVGIKITFFLDRMVASSLAEGSIAALNYATRIVLLPVGLFALPLRTTFYPALSDLAIQHQLEKHAETTLAGLRVLLFMVIPACVGLIVLHVPLTQLLFERGAFDHMATLATSEALIFYAIGVPAVAMIFLLTNVYLSLGSALLLVKINSVNWLANLIISVILSRYFGHQGVALGTSIAVLLTVILMIMFLKHGKLSALNIRVLVLSICRITGIAIVMGMVLQFLLAVSGQVMTHPSLLYAFVYVALLVVVGAVAYLMLVRWFKIAEFHMLLTVLGKF